MAIYNLESQKNRRLVRKIRTNRIRNKGNILCWEVDAMKLNFSFSIIFSHSTYSQNKFILQKETPT